MLKCRMITNRPLHTRHGHFSLKYFYEVLLEIYMSIFQDMRYIIRRFPNRVNAIKDGECGASWFRKRQLTIVIVLIKQVS